MKKKSLVSLLAFVLVFVTVFALMGTKADAITILNGVKLSGATTELTGDGGSLSVYAKGGGFVSGAKSQTLTLTNTNTENVTVSFQYTFTTGGGSYTIKNGNTTVASGSATNATPQTVTMKLGSQATATLSVTGNKGSLSGTEATLNVTDFRVAVERVESIVLKTPVNGGYSVTYTTPDKTKTTTTMTSATADTTIQLILAEGVALKAIPDSGYQFYKWMDKGVTLDAFNATIDDMRALVDGSEVNVEFTSAEYTLAYSVGGLRYGSWEEAVTLAAASNTHVTICADYTLPARLTDSVSHSEKIGTYVTADSNGKLTYRLPSGVKLLVPMSAEDHGNFDGTVLHSTPGQALATPKAYRKLKVSDGAILQIDGILNVNARSHGTENRATGGYGVIELLGDSRIKVNGTLYCYGYVSGSGTVEAMSGGKVHEMLQVADHPGGQCMLSAATNEGKMFLFSHYYIQNIECKYKVNKGANSYVCAYVYADSKYYGGDGDNMPARAVLASSTEQALFKTSRGYFQRSYNATDDRISYDVYGDVVTDGITVTVYSTDMDSTKQIMPITGNMTITIKDGSNVTMKNQFAMLPEAKLIVENGATLNVEGNVSFWDVADWNQGYQGSEYNTNNLSNSGALKGTGYAANNKIGVLPYIHTTGKKSPRTAYASSAKLVVNGTVNGAQNLYVTQHGNKSIDKILTGTGTLVNTARTNSKVTSIEPYVRKTATYLGKNTYSAVFEKVAVIEMVGKMVDSTYTAGGDQYESFGVGTYKAMPTNNGSTNDSWYRFKMTYNYTDANGETVSVVDYITKDTHAFDALALGDTNGNGVVDADEKRYVITDYVLNGTANVDQSLPSAVLNLSGIASDVTVDLTVDEYDYTVSWTDKTGENDVTRVDYISAGEPASYKIDGLWDLSTINVTDASGAAYAVERSIVQTDEENAQSTTLTLTGIDRDIAVSFDGEAASLLVEWIVTGATEATKSQYVATGANVTYTLTQPEDGWFVVESCDVDNAVNAKESVTLNNVQANTTVNLNVVRYDCKVQLISGVDTITDPVAVEPFYMNFNSLGASVEIGVKDISSDTVRYIFDDIKSVSPAGTMYELSKYNDNLKINNLSNKLTTVLVNRRSFDYRVDIQEGNTTLDRQYIQGSAITPYNFANGVYVDSISAVTTANVALTQATATTNAALAVSDVSADTAVKVSTRNFDKVVTFVDASKADGETGRVLKEIFTTASSVTYTCDDRYRVEAATAANGTVSGVGGESITVSGLNGSTTVEVTLDHFDYKVYWKDQAQTNAQNYMAGVLETDYVDAGEAAVYQTADRQVATVFQKPNDVTLTPADGGEKLEATGFAADSEILLNLVDYSYKVTFNAKVGDVTKSITKYAALVDGQWKDVLDNGSIFYDATYNYDANTKYCITGYTLSNAAAAAVALTPENAVNGHTTLKITDLSADQTVDMNLAAVGHKVIWNIQTTTRDGATTTESFVEYLPVDATEARYTFPEGYCVTSVDGTATDRSSNVAVIENITGDVKVTVKAQDYSYKVTWKLTLNGEATTETVFLPVGTNSDTYELEDKFTITEISATNNATVSGLETYTAKVENITADTTVSVTAKDYNYIVNWILYKDGEQTNAWTQYCDALAEMTWTQEDDSYVVTEVVASGALVNHTNKHVDVVSMSGSTATVTIKLETPLDGYTYFFGNMAYKYYKNSAEYTYQEGEGGWALRDTYTWTHVTGSKRHKEVDRDGNKVDYVVPNGSVLLVNNSNQIVKATVTVTSDQTWLTMYLSGNNKKGTVTENSDGTRTSVITFTLRPDDQIYVRGDLAGTPDEISEVAKAAGKWDVQFTPID